MKLKPGFEFKYEHYFSGEIHRTFQVTYPGAAFPTKLAEASFLTIECANAWGNEQAKKFNAI